MRDKQMAKTRHIQQRCSIRGIKQELLAIIKMFGVHNALGDRQILNRKAISNAISELNTIKKLLLEAQKKGGLVLVSEGDTDITIYRLDSFKKF